jgi:hypothetical protein
MAGSGPGGWISGAGWYDRAQERRDKFLAAHPEWNIICVRSLGQYEATGDTGTELLFLHDRSLGTLMDRLEARFPPTEGAE